MAESRTPRVGLPQWSAGTDAPSRADFNEAFLNLETSAALFSQGTLATRPTAGKRGRFYIVVGDATASNNNQVFYDTGTAWITVGSVATSSTGNVITAPNSGTVALKVVGASGQTANLQQWINAAGDVVAYVTVTGSAYFSGLSYGGGSDFDTITVQTLAKIVNDLETKNAKVLGDLTATVFKSTAVRAGDGQPKTLIRGDGTGRMDALIPPGSIMGWATNSAPAGWLFCHGQTVSADSFPDLFAVLGGTYGPASGGSFVLPDFRNRFVMGAGTGNPLGDNEGISSESSRTQFDHIHSHTIASDSAAHTHTISGAAGGSGTTGDAGATSPTITISTAGNHNHTMSLSSAGGHTHTGGSSSAGGHSHTISTNDAGFHSHGINFTTNSNTTVGGTAGRVQTLSTPTDNNGSHNHSASSSTAGDHSHSMSLNSAGDHSHTGSSTSAGDHTHTATITSIPNHNHSFTAPAHDHGAATGSATTAHNHGGNTGGSTAYTHPFLAINYIIKT